MEDLAKIKDRIAKLLAMAKDTSSPNEAAIAAERARKLMDKYQIEAWDTQEVSSRLVAERATKDYRFTPAWMDVLAVAVAKYNDVFATKECSDKFSHKGGAWYTHLQFKGYEDDVKMAQDLYNYLIDQCTKQCKSYMAAKGMGSYYVAKVGDAFKKAWTSEVRRQLEALTEERNGITTATGTALVVVKTDLVRKHFGLKENPYRKSSYKSRTDDECREASAAGRQAGRAQTINQLVD